MTNKSYVTKAMRNIFVACIMLLSCSVASAQTVKIIRGDCTPMLNDDGVAGARAGQQTRRLPSITKRWDADKVYRQLAILVSFSDKDFSMENPRDDFDDMLNKEGYNKRDGAGCFVDYFRCQSGGLLNMQVDVFGPYKVSSKAQPYESPSRNSRNYGTQQMTEATRMFLTENPDIDFSPYDWDGDGYIEHIIFVCAGYCGNQDTQKCYGYIWPNTNSFSVINTPDGKKISDYTVSCELWHNDELCGIGTICHEFTHSLGLPDIYPTSGVPLSAVDEWDLMDGGNFTNYGWCPPNYSALEKMLLGWLTPIELTEPVHIDAMKPVADGGEVYMVKNTSNEYYLLENRQWKGWDLGLPGKGLVIFHVNYSSSKWAGNSVNNNASSLGYQLIHADNMDYDTWYDRIIASGSKNPYVNKPRLNSRILSSSAYPWTTDSTTTVNAELTDTSTPAAVLQHVNIEGVKLMSKPITNITQNPDGTIAFDFMGGDNSGISQAVTQQQQPHAYDLWGRKVRNAHGIVIVRDADGTVRKVMRQRVK